MIHSLNPNLTEAEQAGLRLVPYRQLVDGSIMMFHPVLAALAHLAVSARNDVELYQVVAEEFGRHDPEVCENAYCRYRRERPPDREHLFYDTWLHLLSSLNGDVDAQLN